MALFVMKGMLYDLVQGLEQINAYQNLTIKWLMGLQEYLKMERPWMFAKRQILQVRMLKILAPSEKKNDCGHKKIVWKKSSPTKEVADSLKMVGQFVGILSLLRH